MARRAQRPAKGRGRVRSWTDRRNLLLLETVLLVGLAKEALEDGVLALPAVHPLIRVALGIAVTVGTLGGLLVLFEQQIRRGLEKTHDAVQRLPVPTPEFAVHLAVLGAIFFAYAWFWDDRTGALDATRALLADGLARAVAWVR